MNKSSQIFLVNVYPFAVEPNKRCQVYRNLHNGMWSVRQSGKIIGHTKQIVLKDCRFLVQPAGRKKVLREKRKNVHAYVSGYISTNEEINLFDDKSYSFVSYNPYLYDYFYCKDNQEKVKRSDFVDMFGDFVLAINKAK